MEAVKRYAAMKDSGVEWIGKIPVGWATSKLSTLYTLRSEKVSDRDWPALSVTMKGILPQLETVAKTDDGDNRKLVRKGDFAINSRSDRRGACGISAYDGSVSLINTVLTPRNSMNPEFYDWLFHTELFADEFYKWGHGIVDDLWTTRWSEMKRISIVVPPLHEQQSIASYLDVKCSAIDDIIASIRASIDDYKQLKASTIYEAVTKGLNPDVEMKDSGVEWIENVPKHWIVRKIRHIGTCQNGISKGGEFFGIGTPFVSYKDVYNNLHLPKTVLGKITVSNDEQSLYSVERGDIFFTRTSETIEEIGFSSVCLETIPRATFAGFLIRLRPYNESLLPEYAQYLFASGNNRNYFCKEMTLVTRASLGQTLLKNHPVLLPPLSEQHAIADYLDTRCAEIDSLIAEKEALIADLEAYKKSLIYECVTGKRRVTEESHAA